MALKSPTVIIKGWNLFKKDEENIRSSFNALKTITVEHERAHNGRMFHYSEVSTLAAAATTGLLFSVNSTMPLHLRSISFKTDVGVCEGYLYESPFINVTSLGTGFTPENLNRESSYTSVSSFYRNPFFNVNSAGTRIDAGAIVQATGGSVKSISGEAASAVTEWILARGKNYIFQFTNKNGGTANYVSNIAFYEPTGND